ncbi:nitroreductase family protein, partial [Acinetobacter baumannii]
SAAFARLLNARHSCRAFKPEPVPRATIEAILATAQRTASWTNTQPWQVIVTTGAATERFRDLMVASAQAAEPPQSD